MNWNAIGAVAELGAAIAVFISLVYLAIQIGSQRQESKLAAANDLSAGFNNFLEATASNRGLAEVFVKGLKDLDSLDEVERMQFFSHMARMFRIFEGLQKHNSEGRLDDASWAGVKNIFIDYSAQKGFRKWWVLRRHWYSQQFQDYANPFLIGDE